MTETAIFRIHTKDISRSRIDAAYFLMSPERRERCDRYLREDDKVLCILSDMLLREKLSEKLGIAREELEFSTGENGKPYLHGNPCFFSVSHAEEYVAVALNEKHSVGIDIEKIRPIDFNMLSYFCTEKDIDFIYQGTERVKGTITDKMLLERAFRVWTYKEAYVKSVGGRLLKIAPKISYDEKNCQEDSFEGYRQCIVTAE
ncbi:MAG: 4'-phosphopantetheinyl transferase superfamily protein [Clostridia bacterium]|nr:4'-phosphopantetheinyl transferase superfamily protein [Clostridia bacterium]